MTIQDFAILVSKRFDFCEQLLTKKNKEYAEDGDKLSNFKQAAAMKGETPEKALWGMLAKHIISIKKIIEDLDRDIVPSESLMAEKCSDVINYILLLEALVVDRKSKEIIMRGI